MKASLFRAGRRSAEKGVEKIKDLIKSGTIDKEELHGEIKFNQELAKEGEITFDEKEALTLRNIKKMIC